jgi:hypothetical protein
MPRTEQGWSPQGGQLHGAQLQRLAGREEEIALAKTAAHVIAGGTIPLTTRVIGRVVSRINPKIRLFSTIALVSLVSYS